MVFILYFLFIFFIFWKASWKKKLEALEPHGSCQHLIQINIVAEVCKMSCRFISRILVCHKNPFLAQWCQCCFFHSLWNAVPGLKIWLVLINASTTQRHLAVMGCRISCCVGSVLQDGTVVSEMCWNALLLSWSVRAWVWVALSYSKLSMKRNLCLYVWLICNHGSLLPSCFPSFMQTCVHVHLQQVVDTCEHMALYTRERERNCID